MPTDYRNKAAVDALQEKVNRAVREMNLRRPLRTAPQQQPQTRKGQTIAELRAQFGDERKNPDLFDTFPTPLQRSWLQARTRAGERLTTEERGLMVAPSGRVYRPERAFA